MTPMNADTQRPDPKAAHALFEVKGTLGPWIPHEDAKAFYTGEEAS
jgi:hypothetical protein